MKPTMRQISIALTKPQLQWLNREANRFHITMAEVLRRMIDDILEAERIQKRDA